MRRNSVSRSHTATRSGCSPSIIRASASDSGSSTMSFKAAEVSRYQRVTARHASR